MPSDPTRRGFLTAVAGTGFAGASTIVGSARESAPPVVLVHGYADNGQTPWWDRLESHLHRDGYSRSDVHSISFGDVPGTTVDSPRQYAETVEAELEHLADGNPPVDIVAHSMGGLGSRWCIERLDGAAHVSDLVTLGTPHQGTVAAYLGIVTPGGRDMVPGSDLLETLNGGRLAPGVRYTALWSSTDQLVLPSDRGTLPVELLGGGDENVNTGRQEHIQLVADRRVYRQYRDRLGNN